LESPFAFCTRVGTDDRLDSSLTHSRGAFHYRGLPVEDGYFAAIARRHNLTVVTGNVKDFQPPGVKVFDPFAEIDAM
jgi:predicted nucleic acid-binding protein